MKSLKRDYKKETNEIKQSGSGYIHKVTPEIQAKVLALSSYGITRESISKIIGISHDTLERKYRHELDLGTDDAIAKVAATLFKKAVIDEDVTSIIFFLKTRGRWRTEDNKNVVESNDELKDQLRQLREKLDEKNRKEY